MKIPTRIIRLSRTLALAAFIAGAAVPVALAGPGNAVLDGRSPDTRDAAAAPAYTPQSSLTPVQRIILQENARRSAPRHATQAAQYLDGWYGYAVSRTHDAALAAQVAKYGPRDGWYGYAVSLTRSSGNGVLDGRSPDTVDAALLAHTQVVEVVSSGNFDWGDFGVGAGSAIGLVLLCGGGLGLAYQRRNRMQAA